jgi:cyclohexadienyl dehydratase
LSGQASAAVRRAPITNVRRFPGNRKSGARRLFHAGVTGRFGAMGFRILSLLVVLPLLAGAREPARFVDTAQSVEALVALLDRRLALMPEVAAWKRARGQPVADPAREKDLLDRWESSGAYVGVERVAARNFLEAQIAAARAVQERLIAVWEAGGAAPEEARDLERVLRPELDRLGGEMLAAMQRVAAAGGSSRERETVTARVETVRVRWSLPPELGDRLLEVIGDLRRTAPASIAGLRRTGLVLVGLTGDYAPFSEESGGELRGLDVDLAREFAAAHGLRAEFVRTSWPGLMDDLSSGRFDLAAGGISVTEERRIRAAFGPAVWSDGKTPIARCADRERFSRLEGIDQPGVRVVVNPGGTNERFARANLRRASIRVFPDNRTIFDEILEGRADVMITDGLEVKLQAVRRPGLCGTRSEPFTRADKAWMFPPGSDLTVLAGDWFGPRLASGEFARRLETAITGGR